MKSSRRKFAEGLVSALDRIHAAGASDCSWEQAMEGVCEFVGAKAADLNYVDSVAQQVRRFHPARIDPFVQRYVAEVMGDIMFQNPRSTAIYIPMREQICIADSDVWTAAERASLPFFSELMQPWGAFDALNCWVSKTEGHRVWIALTVHFDRADCPPQDEHRQRLRILLPHLRRACGSEERLKSTLHLNAVFAETLDHVAEPLALIDRDGKVVRANKAIAEIFRRSQGISLARDERIIFGSSNARDSFSKALAQCMRPLLLLAERHAPPPAQIVVQRLDASPLILTVQPLSAARIDLTGVVAALFVSDPDSKAADNFSALQKAYGLFLQRRSSS